MFPTLIEQKSHTIRIYETVLGRQLSGGQRENLERGLLGEALEMLYTGFGDLEAVTRISRRCAKRCATCWPGWATSRTSADGA